ncbi:ARF GTPase-activating protein GIT2 [Lonchura striata]|uniref:ARF GTPase-activating protein GIT2 n=1 Tax=Lonchura striata TaxID=40157 RepID=A0A218V5H0_9PASE|nr:ARF GTPase-activating protein GIT2 [Lonchura striata domestica]
MAKRLRSSEVCADCSAQASSKISVCFGFQMVETLYNNGANSIWEHSLLDPASVMSGRRKASPQDKVHPNKAEFIRAKYQMLAFVHRLPCREDDSVTAKDLSKEKGNTPLHVAAKAGQTLQAELLAVYGADPGTQDSNGKTPVDYARQGGHHELAERLVEIQYELTDRLAFYLCGRKPEHKNGQHFVIPQMADSLDVSELAKAAKKKLQSLSNHLFEELAMDVYDEVDRRETDAVWLATQNHSTLVTETTVVPFLPVNPEYSSTRNQGRQKLARFNAHEFATLVIDILSDAKRRQQGNSLTGSKENVELILKSISNQHSSESQDNDQPDYDSVASDEDTDLETNAAKSNRQKSLDSDLSDGPVTAQEYMQVKNALVASEVKIQQLMKVNINLSDELRIMQKKVTNNPSSSSWEQGFWRVVELFAPEAELTQQIGISQSVKFQFPLILLEWQQYLDFLVRLTSECRVVTLLLALALRKPNPTAKHFFQLQTLQSENTNLRRQATTNIYQVQGGSEYPDPSSNSSLKRRPSARGSRPMSMYETGSGQKPYLPMGEVTYPEENITRLQPFPPHASKLEKQSSVSESDYDNPTTPVELEEPGSGRKGRQRSVIWQGEGSIPEDTDPAPSSSLPSTEDVIRKTEQITKNIQELLRAAQENKHDSYIPCSERIHVAVTEMAALFPKKPKSDLVRTSLRLLTSSAYRLQSECRKALPAEPSPAPDIQLVTQQVIQCAYDIAKAAKQLVTITTKENNN